MIAVGHAYLPIRTQVGISLVTDFISPHERSFSLSGAALFRSDWKNGKSVSRRMVFEPP